MMINTNKWTSKLIGVFSRTNWGVSLQCGEVVLTDLTHPFNFKPSLYGWRDKLCSSPPMQCEAINFKFKFSVNKLNQFFAKIVFCWNFNLKYFRNFVKPCFDEIWFFFCIGIFCTLYSIFCRQFGDLWCITTLKVRVELEFLFTIFCFSGSLDKWPVDLGD